MDYAFSVLGLNAGAGINDVVKAYRRLMYLLDISHYVDTPLADLARQRRQEAEEAYRQLEAHYNAPLLEASSSTLAPGDSLAWNGDSGSNPDTGWLFMGPGLHGTHQEGGWCSRSCDACGNCCECLGDCGDCCSGCD